MQQPHPPIWIGASGEKRMMPIAARYADVWHCFGGTAELVGEVGAAQRAWPRRPAAIPREITRAASLSLEDDPDTIARTIDAWDATPASATSCAAGRPRREQIEAFASNHL